MVKGCVTTVLFDADGVLQDPVERWRPAFASRFALASDRLDTLVQSVIATELEYLTCNDGFLDALDVTLHRCDLVGCSAEVIQILNAIRVDEEIVKIVQKLCAQGVQCHLATNQQPHRARYMSEQIGYQDLFNREFYSCRMGIAKPDIRFFKFILEELDILPRSALFIDDREENVASASEAGLRTSLFPVAGGAAAMVAILRRFGL